MHSPVAAPHEGCSNRQVGKERAGVTHRDHQGVRDGDQAEDQEDELPPAQPAAPVQQQQARGHRRAQDLPP